MARNDKPKQQTPNAQPSQPGSPVTGPSAGAKAVPEAAAHPTSVEPEAVEVIAAETPKPKPASGRRPLTLDLPAKDLTPPPPPPSQPRAAAGEGAGGKAAGAPPRRSLGLVSGAAIAVASGILGALFAVGVVNTFFSAQQNIDSITTLEARALDLRQRVEALESWSDKVRDTLAAAPAATGPAALPDDVAAKLDGLEGTVTALKDDLGGVDAKVAALANAPAAAPAVSPDDLARAQAQITALQGQLATLANEKQAGAAVASEAAGLAALGSLREAVAGGQPYEAELAAVRKLLGARAAALATLDAGAAGGLPTGPALAGRLKAALEARAAATEATPAAPTEEGIVDKLMRSASSLVAVRHSGEAGMDAASVPALAAAQAALRDGQVGEALAALAALPDADKQKLATVIGLMEARQNALAAIAQLNRQLVADLAGRAP